MTEHTPPDTRPNFEKWMRELSDTVKISQIEKAIGQPRSITPSFMEGKNYRPIAIKHRIPIIETLIEALGCVFINGQLLTKADGEFLLITVHGPYAHVDALVVHTSDILNLFSA